MNRIAPVLIATLFAGIEAYADEPPPQGDESQLKTLSGMSVLGNNEAPKSLVIVPWKSSTLGDGLDIANTLDERPTPVDREVFERELRYYGIRDKSFDALSFRRTERQK